MSEIAGLPQADRPATFDLSAADGLAVLPWRLAEQDDGRDVFMRFVDDGWRAVSAAEHLDSVLATARGLAALGVEPGDRVAIMASTRYEWIVLDSAGWAAGAITVPVYPSSSPSQVDWILQDSGARVLVVETETMRAALAPREGVIVFVIDDGALDRLRDHGADVPDEEIRRRADAVALEAPATIVYTSGTTGRPKGCVLTHTNLAAEMHGLLAQPIGRAAGPGKRTLMFLPLAHVLARIVTYAAVAGGSVVGFWPDTATLSDKLGSFRPNLVLGVPRVFEKVHDAARKTAHAKGRFQGRVFDRAEQVAIRRSRAGNHGSAPKLAVEHALFDRLVYRQVRAALGGCCDYAISGGGAMREDLAHFFNGLGVSVYEGYGLTETCAAITVNEAGATRIGTVGRPVTGNQVRIARSGEVQLRGLVVFGEYWNNAEATAQAFDGGWLHTGDLGSLDDDGFLTITGRAKELIVTAGGKNVAPGPLEDVIAANPVVGHALVVGDGRPYVAALITLDPDGVRAWAHDNGRTETDPARLVDDPDLRAFVQAGVDEASATVSRAEGVRRFVLLADDFTEENGELTPTLKVKRHVVAKRYADRIDALYRD